MGPDSGRVDGWANESLISKLRIKIKKLEKDVDHYAQEMSKYRVYWKNECWSADADRYDWGGVLQTAWSSPSPYQEYGEWSRKIPVCCIEKNLNSARNVSESNDSEDSSVLADGE